MNAILNGSRFFLSCDAPRFVETVTIPNPEPEEGREGATSAPVAAEHFTRLGRLLRAEREQMPDQRGAFDSLCLERYGFTGGTGMHYIAVTEILDLLRASGVPEERCPVSLNQIQPMRPLLKRPELLPVVWAEVLRRHADEEARSRQEDARSGRGKCQTAAGLPLVQTVVREMSTS